MTVESKFHPGDSCRYLVSYTECQLGTAPMVRREERYETVTVVRVSFDREQGFKYLVEFSSLERGWMEEKLLTATKKKEVN